MKDKILVDLINLGNLTCGFGNIALNYEKLLAEYDGDEFEFIFLVPKNYKGRFTDKVKYVHINKWQRYFPFLLPKVRIWHSTTQRVKFLRIARGTKLIFTIHDLNFLYEKQWYSILKHLWRLNHFVKKAQAVTVISNYVSSEVTEHLKMRGKEIQVIYNGIEQIDKDQADIPTFVNHERPFFFTIGQIRKKKNFHVLLDVMRSFPEYDLYVCGDDHFDYATTLRNMIEEKKLSNVFVTGIISAPEKVWMYQHCTAFLFPSTLEGFGIPVLEAMQFGKPVFSSACSSLPEVCGGHASIWENFEPEHMIKVLRENLDQFNEDKAEAARQYALTFSYKKHVDAYLELYRNLLQK